MFANVCAAADASYVDLFVEPDQDVFVKDPATYMSIDGLHPNDAGYGVWFSALAPILGQYIKK